MKSLLALLLAATLTAGIAWNVKSQQDRVEQTRLQSESAKKVSELEKSLASEKRRNQSDVRTQQTVVDQLKSQLLTEREVLGGARLRLDVAQNKGLPSGDQATGLQVKLRNQQDVLAEIEAQIRNIKAAEADLGNQGKVAVTQQQADLVQQSCQMTDQIHAQEQVVADTSSRIQSIKKSHEDYDWRDQVKQLEMQLREQNSQLKQLKDLRPQISLRGNATRSELDAQVKLQKSNMHLSLLQMEDRLRQEKQIYADFKRQLDDTHHSQALGKADLAKLQSDFQLEHDKVRSLESQLQGEETRLRDMLK